MSTTDRFDKSRQSQHPVQRDHTATRSWESRRRSRSHTGGSIRRVLAEGDGRGRRQRKKQQK